jgi:hypothetical protein
VIDGKVSSDALDAAVPDSLDWKELIMITVTPAMVAEALYRRGIYKASQLTHQDVRAAFLEAISNDAQALFRNAMEESA